MTIALLVLTLLDVDTIVLSGVDARNQVYNNIIAPRAGQTALLCDAAGVTSPVLNSNDIFSAAGLAYEGWCADQHHSIAGRPR